MAGMILGADKRFREEAGVTNARATDRESIWEEFSPNHDLVLEMKAVDCRLIRRVGIRRPGDRVERSSISGDASIVGKTIEIIGCPSTRVDRVQFEIVPFESTDDLRSEMARRLANWGLRIDIPPSDHVPEDREAFRRWLFLRTACELQTKTVPLSIAYCRSRKKGDWFISINVPEHQFEVLAEDVSGRRLREITLETGFQLVGEDEGVFGPVARLGFLEQGLNDTFYGHSGAVHWGPSSDRDRIEELVSRIEQSLEAQAQSSRLLEGQIESALARILSSWRSALAILSAVFALGAGFLIYVAFR